MTATEAIAGMAALYAAIAAAVEQAIRNGIDLDDVRVALEKSAEMVGESDA